MPKIERWSKLPPAVRAHLAERTRERISLEDLNRLRVWIESQPEVPLGRWYKDFGSFKLWGEGRHPKTFSFGRTNCKRRETLKSLSVVPPKELLVFCPA
jgi:hypothetical protein